MAKGKKQPTPQEIYWARKQREEEEKDALLPPGLVNHGNTCFMNSTLQGLIATPLLHSLVNFEDLPSSSSSSIPSSSSSSPSSSSRRIAARNSPQLTNGHGRGGEFERPWEQGMPLGDVFLALLQKAWGIQQSHVRQSISPKEVLTTIGRKYDQYLDFRQQDAHEFLTHMLDAIRLEEVDVIKKRQPPPPPSTHAHKGKRRRARSSLTNAQEEPQQVKEGANTNNTAGTPEEEKLTPFVDMVFGGKLASILVCDTCKKISVTTEDFHDLSLSIKPEDYFNTHGQRKRDRFRGIAKKLRLIPKSGSSASGIRGSGGMGLGIGIGMGTARGREGGGGGDRASSVPASPIRSSLTLGESGEHDHLGVGGEGVDTRRRSLEHISGNTNGDGNTSGPSEEDAVLVGPNGESDLAGGAPISKEDSHVSFAETAATEGEKKEREKDKEDAWGKLGRRISMSMGGAARREKRLSRSKSNSRANSRERTGTSTPRLSASSPLVDGGMVMPEGSPSLNSPSLPRLGSPGPSNASGALFSPPSRQHSAVGLSDLIRQHKEHHKEHHQHRDEKSSSRPYKPTREESAYMRKLLADVNPSGSSTFSLIHQALSGHSPSSAPLTAQALLVKMGHLPGIEECLRLFTAVEVLDGDNMVGCHRCWKIANGTYRPRKDKERDEDDSEEADEDEGEDGDGDADEDEPVLVDVNGEPRPSVTRVDTASSINTTNSNLPGYISPASTTVITETVVASSSSSIFSADNASVSSAPTTVQSVTPPAPPPPKILPSPLNADLLQQPISPSDSHTPDVPLPEYGGLPIPVISTTGPDTPVTSPAAAGSLQQSQEGAFITKGTLHPPSIKKRRVEDGVSGDESDDSDSDASGDTSALSDVSSLASPSASPSVSPSASVERLERTSTQESIAQKDGSRSHGAPNGNAAATTSKVPRSEQVILRRTYKRYLIASPPPVLVIHLKRFQQTSRSPYAMSFSSGFKKLDDFVAFPEYLDLKPFLAPRKEEFGLGRHKKRKDRERGKGEKEGECMYRLYAVVVHIGNMLGGHYVAYTALPPSNSTGSSRPSAENSGSSASTSTSSEEKSPPENERSTEGKRQWAFISDTNVRLVALEEVLKAKAYLCMYERI
ncbi:hypothetical protein BC629DRAFT_1587063 [Irpex lacteus]|nr:hypothetical protein BC629DRAFT_1587063 [Irpex lacteus]